MPNSRKNQFERWYGETIPHMDFGSHKAMIEFAWQAGVRAGQTPEEMVFEHVPNEPKDRQKGEEYLTWLKRTLSFARTYGAPDEKDASAWACGYCALGRHEDCIVDCGCSNPACQPHSSGTTGAGFHDFA